MLFNSVTYLIFLPMVVIAYWVLPQRARLWMLFLTSLTFYAFWRIEFVPIMLLSAVIDYIASLRIYGAKEQRTKKLWLLLSLCANLGLLFYFKYLLFMADNMIGLLHFLGMETNPILPTIILPLGISFYTFQTISYTIDVYRGFIQPEKDFILYGCYVTYFPQLVAGPILRAVEVIPQLRQKPVFDLSDLALGVRRILYGLFLKVVLADNIAPLVNTGFDTASAALSALDVWTLAFLFGFQIYFDFCAYSHIAIGSAQVMGIHFPENFDFPYLATSPRDFWRRWHISLSSWIRDYLYLPLTGTKVHDRSTGGLEDGTSKTAQQKTRALFLTWSIMGLWHGANWTFLLWGIYHAILIYIHRKVSPLTSRLPNLVTTIGGWSITVSAVMLSWIAFRAPSVTDAIALYSKVLQPQQYLWLGLRENSYIVAFFLLIGVVSTYFISTYIAPYLEKNVLSKTLSESLLFSFIIALVFVFLRPIDQFIYFQF